MNKNNLTTTEQTLLDELNYKAKLIIDLENLFKEKKITMDSNRLYEFNTKQLKTMFIAWQ